MYFSYFRGREWGNIHVRDQNDSYRIDRVREGEPAPFGACLYHGTAHLRVVYDQCTILRSSTRRGGVSERYHMSKRRVWGRSFLLQHSVGWFVCWYCSQFSAMLRLLNNRWWRRKRLQHARWHNHNLFRKFLRYRWPWSKLY